MNEKPVGKVATNSGAAYVFVRRGTNWTQQAYLKASNAGPGDSFGHSVAVSGGTVVVGAPWDGSSGFHRSRDDTVLREAGSAFVFVRNGTNWVQAALLRASRPKPGNQFGWSVAVSGDTLLVGAIGESSKATGVNGDQNDTSCPSAGAAYVFVRQGNSWKQEAYLKASNTDKEDQFGTSVAVSRNYAVIGAPREASRAPGINGDQSDNTAQDAGAAYVFVRTGTNWSQEAYLKASNADAEDWFGKAVAISRETVVVGADEEDSKATGVNGDASDNTVGNSGAAYVFVRRGGNWNQQAYLKPFQNGINKQFGGAVAISGETLVVGAQVTPAVQPG